MRVSGIPGGGAGPGGQRETRRGHRHHYARQQDHSHGDPHQRGTCHRQGDGAPGEMTTYLKGERSRRPSGSFFPQPNYGAIL